MRHFVSAASQIISALFCHITQRTVVISYRRYKDDPSVTSSRVKKSSWPLAMGPICFPETSVRNYHRTLGNMPEDRRPQVLTTKYGPTEKETRDEIMWRNVVLGEVKPLHSWQSLDGWMGGFSWFQAFAVCWMLYAFFWIIPRSLNWDAGELPRRKHTTFRTRRTFEIRNTSRLWGGNCKIQTPGNYPERSVQHGLISLNCQYQHMHNFVTV